MHDRPPLTILLFVIVYILLAQPALAQPIRAVRFGTASITNTGFVTAPLGDTSRIFVADLGATIYIMNAATGALNPTPFLTVPNHAALGVQLLGMAFHPDYANNGFFYLYYTLNNPPAYPAGRMIARYHVSSDPDVADSASRFHHLLLPKLH